MSRLLIKRQQEQPKATWTHQRGKQGVLDSMKKRKRARNRGLRTQWIRSEGLTRPSAPCLLTKSYISQNTRVANLWHHAHKQTKILLPLGNENTACIGGRQVLGGLSGIPQRDSVLFGVLTILDLLQQQHHLCIIWSSGNECRDSRLYAAEPHH